MEQALDTGYQRLLDQGVLGIVVVLLVAAVVYQQREIQALRKGWLDDVRALTRECVEAIRSTAETLRNFRG